MMSSRGESVPRNHTILELSIEALKTRSLSSTCMLIEVISNGLKRDLSLISTNISLLDASNNGSFFIVQYKIVLRY